MAIGRFTSCLLPLCQTQSSREAIHMEMCKFRLQSIFAQIKIISLRKVNTFCTKTRFETEVQENLGSTMAYKHFT